MPSFECTKCHETMTSKNPAIRTIFADDGVATTMTHIVNVSTERNDKDVRVVVFEFPYVDGRDRRDNDKEDDELEMECARMIKGLTDDQIVHWLCNHKWELIEGEISVRC